MIKLLAKYSSVAEVSFKLLIYPKKMPIYFFKLMKKYIEAYRKKTLLTNGLWYAAKLRIAV